MKSLLHRTLALLVCSAWCALPPTLSAQVPNLMNHQGRVAVNGVNFDGTGQFKFALVNADGSTSYWSNDGTSVAGSPPAAAVSLPVTKGLYSVMLGDTTDPHPKMAALPASVFQNADVRLRVWFNDGTLGFQQLSPDQRIAPNGYLPDGAVSSGKIANGAVTSAKLAAGAVSQLSAPDGSPLSALQVDAGGLVGIGTETPKAGLEIASGRTIQVADLLSARVDGRDGYSALSGANSVAVAGNLIAVTAWATRSLTLIDKSDPENPIRRYEISANDPGSEFLFAGISAVAMKPNLLAVAARTSNAVTLLDVTNPATPIKRSELRQGVNGYNRLTNVDLVAISGNLLVAAEDGSNALTFVDISNPSAPVRLLEVVNGTFGFTKLQFIQSIAINGNLLAAGGESGTVLMDISVPTAPVLRSEVSTKTTGLALANGLLAIASPGKNQLTLLDVTNPASPVTRAILTDGVNSDALQQAYAVSIEGDRMAVGTDAENAVSIWDISNPAAPVELAVARQGAGGFRYLDRPRSVALSGGIVAAVSYTPGAVSLIGLKDRTAALTSMGWVGIGVAKPDAALHVRGNLLVEGADHVEFATREFHAGSNTSASGLGATAFGYASAANGESSIATGTSQVWGSYSTACGMSTIYGDFCVALGSATARSASVAIGYGARATGNSSLALGRLADSESAGSTAIGLGAKAAGVNAVSIGTDTRAQADGSAAIGTRATAAHDRSFVWNDGRDAQAFSSTSVNQFLIRASGGVGINTNNPGGAALAVTGNIVASGSITGSGAGLTNLNAESLTGTIAEARLPTNVALRGGGNAFIGNQSITGNVGIGTNATGQMLQVGDVNTPDSQGMMRFASRSGTGPSSRYWDIGVPEGDQNTSGKNYSFVIDDPTSGGDPEMTIRWDTGNVGIGIANPTAKLDVNGAYLRVVGGGNEQAYIGGDGSGGDVEIGSRNPAISTVGFWNSASFQHMNVVALSFNPTSDRNLKENFEPVDAREVLEKVAAMPISRWNFKGDAGTPHIGPMAQDFHAAFGTGADDKHIATVDADGVALAAIQGLNEKLKEKDSEIADLISETLALREENQAIEARLAALEELLSRQPSARAKSTTRPSAP